jgi:hypothetical protein
VRSARFPWWPAVVVNTAWNGVRYGDLDGDGRDEAVVDVVCSNAGGTAAGQLAFSSVVFAARGRSLRSIGTSRRGSRSIRARATCLSSPAPRGLKVRPGDM